MSRSYKIPTLAAVLAGCFTGLLVFYLKTAAAEPAAAGGALETTRDIMSWLLAAGGFIAMLLAIGYGFAKKQKYENIEKDRDEWRDLAESREERIKELKHTHGETEAKLKLTILQKETEVTNLKESNGALVSQSLQMKAILRGLRLDGSWQGHEDRIHDTQG